jgi:hypothetical protein
MAGLGYITGFKFWSKFSKGFLCPEMRFSGGENGAEHIGMRWGMDLNKKKSRTK